MADKKFILREYLLDIDSFNKPRILGDQEAMASLLTRLLLLEPGTNPLFPEMGVGLVSKYRFLYPGDDSQLKQDIRDQISMYLPEASMQEVNLIYNEDKTVNIEIDIDENQFIYDSSIMVPITLADIANG